MIEETTTQPTERHNAMVSYCFLAPFMLLSRDDRFQSDFFRWHARYALLLQWAFLWLIILLIRSRNFESMIIFWSSWLHIILFVSFLILLWFLGAGIYTAFRGESPKIVLQGLSWSSLKNIWEEAQVSEAQKTPLILSHIPFIGTYLSHKYGDFLNVGEKFGNWVFILWALSLWIDESMTLFIVWITLSTFWIVYQATLVSSGDNIRLIGSKLPGGTICHILLRSVISYCQLLFNHDDKLPLWSTIIKEKTESYTPQMSTENTKLTIPIINIPSIVKFQKWIPFTSEIIQAIIINILTLYAIFIVHIPLLMLLMLGIWWMYWQAKNHQDISLPLLGEVSTWIVEIIAWKKKKSTTKETHLTSTPL